MASVEAWGKACLAFLLFVMASLPYCTISTVEFNGMVGQATTGAELAISQDEPNCGDKCSSRHGPLACWLWMLKVKLSDQSFKRGGISVKLSELECSRFVLDRIESNYVPSDRDDAKSSISANPSLDLAARGISATCTGIYKSLVYSGKLSLTAKTKPPPTAGMKLRWDFVSSTHFCKTTEEQGDSNIFKYWMPTGLTTQQCQANLVVSGLRFYGSMSAELINAFKDLIEGTVTSKLNEELCPTLKQAVDPFVSDILLYADRLLTKYLPLQRRSNNTNNSNDLSATSSTYRHPQATTIDFEKDAPVLINSLRSISHFLDCYYLNGANIRNSCTSVFTGTLKGLFSTLLDSLADPVRVPIPNKFRKIHFNVPNYGQILLDVQNLHVAGLGRLEVFSLLPPRPSCSFLNTSLRSGSTGLNVSADVNITVSAIRGGTVSGNPLHEAFRFHVNISKLDLLGSIDLALDREQFFKGISMGTLMDAFPGVFHQRPSRDASFSTTAIRESNSTMNRRCLFKLVHSLRVADIGLQTIFDSASFVPRSATMQRGLKCSSRLLTDELEKDLDGVLNNAMKLILREYQPLLSDAASGIAQSVLAPKVNDWIYKELRNLTQELYEQPPGALLPSGKDNFLPASADLCGEVDERGAEQLVNFTRLSFLRMLNQHINTPSNLASINMVIDKLTQMLAKLHNNSNMNESALIHRPNTSVQLEKSGIPRVTIHLLNLQMSNFGSIQHVDLLSPEIDGLRLKNGFMMSVNTSGELIDGGNVPTIHAAARFLDRQRNIIATLNSTWSLDDVHLDGGSILYFDLTRLRRLALHQLLSHGHCVIAPFEEHRIYNNHNVSRIGSLFANASATVRGGLKFENFTVSFDTREYPTASFLATSVVAWTMTTLQEALNSATRSGVEQAKRYCTGGQKFGYDDDPPVLEDGFSDQWLLPVLGVSVSVFVCAQGALFCSRCTKEHSSEVRRTATQRGGAVHVPLNYESGERESTCHLKEQEEKGYEEGETLLQSTVLSALGRQTVLVFTVGTIVLLLSSNISRGATVDVYVTWNEKRTQALPGLFGFSLLSTAKDMWNANIYFLFFLVLIMSGLWPYVKLLLMAGSWSTPPTILPPRTRERLLLALDALGKFSLVDTYLFVLFEVAFRVHMDVSTMSVDVNVTPETGFYSFLAATCFSLLVGHFMVHAHRVSEMRNFCARQEEKVARSRELISRHKNALSKINERTQLLKQTRGFRTVLVLVTLLASVLLCVGITQNCFRFEIGGIAGDVLGDHRIRYYSLVSIGSSLRRSVRDKSSLGIFVLQITYFFFAIATPFACLAILLILLVYPMSLGSQRWFLTLAEIANAWSAAEVFVISATAALFEISTFASFMVGHRCDLMRHILKEYFESAITVDSDATCFTVKPSVERSGWCLVLGVLVNSVTVSLLLRFAHWSLTERLAEMKALLDQPADDDPHSRPKTPSYRFYGSCSRSPVFVAEQSTDALLLSRGLS